ncbi:PfaD family polyunsaturated fatty acid/polyketide biosynthesis protein [Marinivivus vitaminiproducens]|uniref:PfaD family polyunsaturated fatty acid/polyketide biosynthesis protein n=1 Tax=Marinivivus vitaminiproducens TaxID=3035935 RepID=UPI0027994C2C|nr:PfaD family polyunsaturated fatty acid/polyketide biosynthesis protein [Geminicoccaceae bacterium SCSIO 64248]
MDASPIPCASDRPSSTASDVLGDVSFLADHGVRHPYVAGAMGKGIASEEWVVRLARAGILSFFGAGGLPVARVASAIRRIRAAVGPNGSFGVNLLHSPVLPAQEDELVDLLLAEQVDRIEASAFVRATPALVRYRVAGLASGPDGSTVIRNRVIAKVSRPEVARQFFAPPDGDIVRALLGSGRITAEQARLAQGVPLADDVCAEADSGGHTDRRVAYTLVPHFRRLRDEIAARTRLRQRVRIGAAGGIGTPEAAAAAFMLGADFILTGSINQCTPEAGISETAKDMLAQADLADVEIAPAGDMFELGAKVQVLKRGSLFAGRANRLYELYRTLPGLDAIPADDRREIEERYFGRTIDAIWQETADFYAGHAASELVEAEANPRKKMAMVFRWYFIHSSRLAIDGRADQRANFQIHCGPAMGAANRWLKGTALEDWRRRHVDVLADRLMQEAAAIFVERLDAVVNRGRQPAPTPMRASLR